MIASPLQLLLLRAALLCCLGLHFLPPAHGGETTTAVQVFYVKPTENTSCPEPCHTLDEYVQNTTWYFLSNTTFRFLPGNHELSQSLNVSGVANLVLVAASGTVNITCRCKSLLNFTDVSNLTLQDLTLSMCGTLVLTNLLNLNLLEITMHLPVHSYTVYAKNILGNSTVAGFGVSSPWPDKPHLEFVTRYDNKTTWPIPAHNQLAMKDSDFSGPDANMYVKLLFDLKQLAYTVSLLLENITSNNFSIQVTSRFPNMHTYIRNCNLLILHFHTSGQVTIEKSIFSKRFKLVIYGRGSMPVGLTNMVFSNTQPKDMGYVFMAHVEQLSFINCSFHNSSGQWSKYDAGRSVVMLYNSRNVNFTNCEFSGNRGTPILAGNSSLILSGSTSFTNNRAYRGGAMAFYGLSYVTFANGSDVQFVNNSAETVGGAIYVDYEPTSPCFYQLQLFCTTYRVYSGIVPASVQFHNNTARNGGNSIYGASLDLCKFHNSYCMGWQMVSPVFHINQQTDSDLSTISSDPTRVCLCENERPFCTTVVTNLTRYPGEPFQVSVFLVGDRFGTVDGSVYAQLLHLGTGVVAELEDLEHSQQVEHQARTEITYTILTNSTTATLALTATNYYAILQRYPKDKSSLYEYMYRYYIEHGYISPGLQSFPVYIDITFKPCPLGFVLSGEPPRCTCDTQLLTHHITCNLTTQTVQRSGSEWINASFHGNTSNGVIVNMHCPNGYCKPETVEVNLEYPDTQCAFSHSGILCGGCQSGLSLALGSAQCVPCSNDFLALLIPFALAGVALVLFIWLLNLTVVEGTLNGFIFYANIVRANQTAWIPSHDTNILMVFIAWFNLDLGIETCFFDGMDAYWRTWLQFVFPLYIWAIVIIIIVLSHYFSTAAKIFGNNSVPILATLFLLSYSKLLRTIISIFQSSTLDYPDGTSATVWSYDGNVPYFSPKRIPLILVALMVLLFLWLPYTGTLLFAQCLHKIHRYRVAHLLLRLKPFLDAYFGPLKDKHRYWIGLLLLVRGVLFVVYAATPTNMANINLLATGIVMFCLLVYPDAGHVYRETHLNLLENSFFLNLGLLALGTLYVTNSQGSQVALAHTSTGIALVQLIGIVLFHTFTMLKTIKWTIAKWFMKLRSRKIEIQEDSPEEYESLPEVNTQGMQVNVHFLNVDDFREPVLNYIDD